MKPQDKNKLEAECWIPLAGLGDDWIVRVGECIPSPCQPLYFGASERFDKRRVFPFSDTAALRKRTKEHQSAALHGEGLYIDAAPWDRDYGRVIAYFRSAQIGTAAVSSWFRALERCKLNYARACLSKEYDHRHKITIDFAGGNSGHLLAYIGRNYTKYVPGLYWLNYFSNTYIQRMNLDVHAIAKQAAAATTSVEGGYFLQLYEWPHEWELSSERVDTLLEGCHCFFSLRKAQIPRTIEEHKATDLIFKIGREWP